MLEILYFVTHKYEDIFVSHFIGTDIEKGDQL